MTDKSKKVTYSFLQYVVVFSLCILLVLFITNKFVFILKVPSESMQPTMNVNEHFITKMVRQNEKIDYGIYGFYSKELDDTLVKRIVGLPGDHIEFVDGKMYRNSVEIDEDYILYEDFFSGTFDVPDGHYLMLGDNRVDSFDARYWNTPYIPREDIIGKVLFRIRPFFRIGFVK